MKHVMQVFVICFLLIIPSNMILYTPAGSTDKNAFSNLNIIQNDSILRPIIRDEKLSFGDKLEFFIQPGRPPIPTYTATWTFPVGTIMNTIKIQANTLSLKQNTNNISSLPSPSSSSYTPIIGQRYSFTAIPLDRRMNHLKDWYDIRMGTGIKNNERVLFVSIAFYPTLFNPSLKYFIIPDDISISFDYEEPLEIRTIDTSYDTLILTIKDFKDILQPFIMYKQNNNKILLETIENIPDHGRDIQEDIKLFIRKNIEEHNIKNVLFVGGYNQIPVRNVFVQEIRSILMDDNIFISDLYYADIYDANGEFCSWDSNNNDIFGEFNLNEIIPSDTVDLYPDVYFGRLACRTQEELRTYINKTILYETNLLTGSEWFNNAIVIGSDTFTEDILGISEGEEITESISKILHEFNVTRLWGSNGQLQYAKDISNAIEKGALFVAFEGHAGSNSYRTHPLQSPSEWIPLEWYRTYHINELMNQYKLPIVSINACNTCKFSVNHTCFGWSFIMNPDGGSIATVGMTCLSWIYPGIFCTYGLGGLLHQNFYRAYTSGATTFGQLWADSINQYLNDNPWHLSAYDHKTLKAWQPLGDPTFQLPHTMLT